MMADPTILDETANTSKFWAMDPNDEIVIGCILANEGAVGCILANERAVGPTNGVWVCMTLPLQLSC